MQLCIKHANMNWYTPLDVHGSLFEHLNDPPTQILWCTIEDSLSRISSTSKSRNMFFKAGILFSISLYTYCINMH